MLTGPQIPQQLCRPVSGTGHGPLLKAESSAMALYTCAKFCGILRPGRARRPGLVLRQTPEPHQGVLLRSRKRINTERLTWERGIFGGNLIVDLKQRQSHRPRGCRRVRMSGAVLAETHRPNDDFEDLRRLMTVGAAEVPEATARHQSARIAEGERRKMGTEESAEVKYSW